MNAEAPAFSGLHRPVVKPVTDRRDWKEFLNFARQVYVNDPHWVEPLRFERRRQWASSHPWFAHAEAQPMLARLDGRVVGTISAQIDRLQPPEHGRTVGYFGQLEAIDSGEVFNALLDAAGEWLKERGCQTMRGPYDLAINQACGLLVEGADSPPMVMMGHAPAWYGPRLEACGLEKSMDLLAYLLEPNFEPPAAMGRIQQRMGQRIRFRTMDFTRYDREVALLRDIFNDAWSENWGFVPLTEAEFTHMGRELRQIIRPGYTCIAEVDGQAAGFLVGLPNINELIADLGGRLLPFGWARLLWRIKRKRARTARVPLMGVRRAHQRGLMGAAVSFGMIDQVRHALYADGIRDVEMSWILETNQGMNSLIEAMGGRLSKRYRMYHRQLD